MQNVSALDLVRLREVYGRFPSAVVAVGAWVDDRPKVLVASTFTVGISLDPPLALFAMRKESTTWPHLRTASRLGISLLSDAQDDLCSRLAARTGEIEGTSYRTSEGGAIVFGGAAVTLDCSIHSETDAGDHTVVLVRIHAVEDSSDVEPLIFHRSRYRRLQHAG